jgi:hypothetical protein
LNSSQSSLRVTSAAGSSRRSASVQRVDSFGHLLNWC